MAEYTKPWLSVDQQIQKLADRGVDVGDLDHAARLLEAVGYYRLTGYLYPFRQSEQYTDGAGSAQVRILNLYRPGVTLRQAADIIDFDRRLRMLVMDGVERIEVAIRMRVGYVLGRSSPFAHEDPVCFIDTFTTSSTDADGPVESKHVRWLRQVGELKAKSDERFIDHFRQNYDNRVPVWALTEILQFGQLTRLYQGVRQKEAEEIADCFGVPGKRLMASWLATVNYVRNLSAHNARLFNRKLQQAPRRPKVGQVPDLDHLHR